MKRRRLPLTWALVAGLLACQPPPPPPDPPKAPMGEAWLTPDEVTQAGLRFEDTIERDVALSVVTTGRITFDDLKVSHVFPPVTGRVIQINANLGEHVKKGQALAVLESPDLGQFSSDVNKARSAFVAAGRDFERQKSLYEGHAAAQRDFEAAQDVYLQAKAELERASQKAKLLFAGADTVTQQYTLRALIDGEVIARTINPGMEVQGQYSGGSPQELFTVGALDTVWAFGDLFEMDMTRVHKGDDVSVKVIAYPNQVFTGTVDWVSDALDPNTRTARVRCVIDNKLGKLKPEMFATVSIVGQKVHTLAVPNQSVYHLAGKTVVFVQAGQAPDNKVRFERREVTVDEDNSGDYTTIHKGLKVGEKLVVAGGILLTEMAVVQ